ncbi:MAG: hypothetical protein IT513_16190 [Burkholderiales bacterium]|nr:hypothetical protein [Burkholderiales bacterium]
MSRVELLTEFDFASGARRGARLALYADRLVLHGDDAMETVPLAHLASVRVAFERDARKLNWAIGLALAALILAGTSGPLQAWMQARAVEVKKGGAEWLQEVLLASFEAIQHLARLFVPVALALFAGAVGLLFFFWLGQTTLTLSFAATERVFSVRGRNRLLFQFGDSVAEQLAAPRGRGGA